jgi:hypothetical protein
VVIFLDFSELELPKEKVQIPALNSCLGACSASRPDSDPTVLFTLDGGSLSALSSIKTANCRPRAIVIYETGNNGVLPSMSLPDFLYEQNTRHIVR